jgi:hypothetical protein
MEQLPTFQIPELELVFLLIVKVFLLLAAFLYLVFAILVTRQISLMKQTLETPFSGIVSILGWLHLLAALFVMLIFALVL